MGVPGEWEWRLGLVWTIEEVAPAAAGVAVYAAFVAVGLGFWRERTSRTREALALVCLFAAAALILGVVQTGAPSDCRLSKWVIALQTRVAGGYHGLARKEGGDLARFLREYPEWVRLQDPYHVGTHPPGLIALQSILLSAFDAHPALVRFVEDHTPDSIVTALRTREDTRDITPVERSTVLTTGAVTLLACSATVLPLFFLARSSLPARSAWTVAALWPLVPSADLFLPLADTAYPLLSTTALALAANAGKFRPRAGRLSTLLCGVVLAVGMQFSLVFLPVGLVVALVLASASGVPRRERAIQVLATGVGFLGATGLVWAVTRADPFVIWWWNQKNHARFYEECPRSYWAWVLANPIELAVAVGIPVTVWASVALAWPRSFPRTSLATLAVLAFLTLSGRSLSEVARLWLPFMPALLVAAGLALDRCQAGRVATAWTTALLGVQTLGLQAIVRVIFTV